MSASPFFSRSAYLLRGGAYTTLAVPGASVTDAYGINNSGQIVGAFIVGNPRVAPIQGFLLSGGTYTTLNLPGVIDTEPHGINNSGQIVGVYDNGTRGFVLSGGSFNTLLVPGSAFDFTSALGINNLGQIVAVHGVSYNWDSQF